MADITGVGALILAVKHASDVVKTVRELDVSLEKAELRLKLVDLMETLSGVREQAIEIKAELQEKNERINELEELLKLKAKITFKEPVYYMEGDSVPFCQKCWELNSKPIHLKKLHPDYPSDGWYHCPVCTETYNTKPSNEEELFEEE